VGLNRHSGASSSHGGMICSYSKMQVTNGLSSGVGFEGEILSELDY
jgi:hypothetical protein